MRELQHGCVRGHHVCHACHAQWRPHDEACLICIPYVEGDGAFSNRVEDAEEEEEEEQRGDFPGCIRRILLPYLFPCNMLFVFLCAMVFKGVTYGVLAARQELPAPAWAWLFGQFDTAVVGDQRQQARQRETPAFFRQIGNDILQPGQ